jgi:chorismate mutase
LLLMPDVAAAKRAAGLPIGDAARESEVVARAGERARVAGLAPEPATRLARAEIGAARAVQEATRPAPEPGATNAPTLAALRAGIDALDAALVRALVTARTAGASLPRARVALALRTDADVVGFDDAHAGAIAAALAEILRAPAAG